MVIAENLDIKFFEVEKCEERVNWEGNFFKCSKNEKLQWSKFNYNGTNGKLGVSW